MILRSIAVSLSLSFAIGLPPTEGAELIHFSVSQVRQLDVGAAVVRAYLDLADSAGQPPASLPDSSLEATLGEWPTETVSVAPFTTVRQGIAYVFLVDISRSLSPELFEQMVGGIVTWIQGMDSMDRAALIAFGESSRLIVDFTSDKEQILAGLASLGPTDDETLLHQALVDALELSRRLDPDLPGRRALVIFSDGKDEGSGYEAEDVLDKMRDNPSPIYAIGYSRLRDPAEHRRYLNLLQRLATNSGGVFFAAEQTRFAQAYDTIRQTIRRVWVTDFLCTECRTDGSLHRLQVRVTIDGQVLSSGGSVRLLPLMRTTAPETAPPAAAEPSPIVAEESVPVAAEEPVPPITDPSGPAIELQPWLIGLVVLAAGLLFWGLRVRSQRAQPSAPRDGFYPPPPGPPPPLTPPTEPIVLDPPMPVPGPEPRPLRSPSTPTRKKALPTGIPRQVRLIIVRGSRKGRQYSFVVKDRAVVGRRSSCDCVLAEETGIDATQFELINKQGDLYLENLSDRLPTLISGRPVIETIRLTTDTLVGTGETVLRIVFH